MKQSIFKQPLNLFFIILILFAVYLPNVIYGKFILTILLFYFLNKIFYNVRLIQKIIVFLLTLLSLYLSVNFDKCFLLALPIILLFNKTIKYDNNFKLFFLNSVLLVSIIENIYYTGINTTFAYYLWGLPIIIISIILTKIKPQLVNILLSIILTIVIVGELCFNLQNYNKDIYTYSNKNNVVSNYKLLGKYFEKVHNNENNIMQHSTIILPISENPNIYNSNIISKNNNYIILGEHDNLNNVSKLCSYINDDGYYRKAPWYVYTPNINSRFKYFAKNDIFYSSNIGATINSSSPLIWEYSNWGKPIILAGFKKVNGANLYIFGDSDFLVNKLMPYNINFVSGLLNRTFALYPIFIILFILTNIFILKDKKYISIVLFILMLIAYFLPYKNNWHSEINVYSQDKYLTAHTNSYSSSILNFLAQNNIATAKSDQSNAQVQIIKGHQKWKKYKKSQLIYLLPNTALTVNDNNFFCSNIKLGTENQENNEIIDARVLILNNKITNTSFYNKDNINFVCTGSPQLNYKLTRSIILHEK